MLMSNKWFALFFHILVHHVNNQVIKFRFLRFGKIVSRNLNVVLNVVICLQGVLLKKPKSVSKNFIDKRWKWKWFKVLNLVCIDLINSYYSDPNTFI